MNDDMTNLRARGKVPDTDLSREMIGFAAHRLMERGRGTDGSDLRRKEPGAPGATQPISRSELGDPCRHVRATHPQAAQTLLLPRLPGAAVDGREGAHGSGAGSLRPRRLDDLVQAMRMSGISKSQVSRLCAEIDDKIEDCSGRSKALGPIYGSTPPT